MATEGQRQSQSGDGVTITDEHKNKIQSCRVELVGKLNAEEVLDYLLRENVFSQRQFEDIKAKGPSDSSVNGALVDALVKSTEKGYRIFVEALRKTNKNHLANAVEGKKEEMAGRGGNSAVRSKGDRQSIQTHSTEEIREEMSEARVSIQTHYDVLVQKMNPYPVITHLLSCHLLTDWEARTIQSKGVDEDVNEALLSKIMKMPDRAYDELIQSLKASKQGYLAAKLDVYNIQ